MTLTAGMLLLVRTIVEAPDQGWAAPETIGAFALGAILLSLFVAIERRSARPLVRLGILRSGSLVRANLGMMTMFGAYVGFQFVMTLYLQTLNGWSPIETALAFLPAGLLVALGSPRIGPLVDRFGTPRLIALGALVVRHGLHGARAARHRRRAGLRLGAPADDAPARHRLRAAFPTLNIQATSGVADHEQGLASGLVQTSFQVGGAIGLAIVSAIVTGQAGGSTDTGVILDAYRTALIVVTGVAIAGLAMRPVGPRACRRRASLRSPRPTARLRCRRASPRGVFGAHGEGVEARDDRPERRASPRHVRSVHLRRTEQSRRGSTESRRARHRAAELLRRGASSKLPSLE